MKKLVTASIFASIFIYIFIFTGIFKIFEINKINESFAKSFPETLDIKDMAERSVVVPFNPSKIICIGPGTLRLIVYLNAQNKLCGIEDMEKLNPVGRPYWLANLELAKLPIIGPGGVASINKKPDLEAILSVHPDLIFVMQMDKELANQVQKQLNIPVVVLSYGAFATFEEQKVYESLKLAGKILNCATRAESVIDFIESAKKELQSKTQNIDNKQKPSVFIGGIGFKGSFGIESSEKNYIPFKWTNTKNIIESLNKSDLGKLKTEGSHIFIDKEKLLFLNPDVIFIDGGGIKLIEEDIAKKPDYYKALKAFNNKHVYKLLPFNFYTTNIETVIIDAYAIAKILYPKVFEDINIEKKADEIYSFMVGKPVYKQMEKNYGKIGKPCDFIKNKK